jgi:hypothetical protein
MKRNGLKRVAAFVLFSAALTGGSNALLSQGTSAQRRDCHGDAMRLCGQHVPNVAEITACMTRHRPQLSPACRAHFRR